MQKVPWENIWFSRNYEMPVCSNCSLKYLQRNTPNSQMPSITFIMCLNCGQLLPDAGEQNDSKVVVRWLPRWLESGDTALSTVFESALPPASKLPLLVTLTSIKAFLSSGSDVAPAAMVVTNVRRHFLAGIYGKLSQPEIITVDSDLCRGCQRWVISTLKTPLFSTILLYILCSILL